MQNELMALCIKDAKADWMARELARATGETITQAVSVAVEERLARARRRKRGGRLTDELDEIAKRCGALPVHDFHTPDEILGFDEHGLPG